MTKVLKTILVIFLFSHFLQAQTIDSCGFSPGIIVLNGQDYQGLGESTRLKAQGCENALALWYLQDPTGDPSVDAVQMGEYYDVYNIVNGKEEHIPIYLTCFTDHCESQPSVYYFRKPNNADEESGIVQSTINENIIPTIPPAPNAAALGKYATVPVSYYSGLPNTEIPIYTIQDQDITIPISMSYHHGGVRVEEEASRIGLGWTLNSGGAVTRTIRGGDDLNEFWGYAFNTFPQDFIFGQSGTSVNAYYQKYRQYGTDLDTQPDLFYYNIGGVSGKFVIEADDNNVFPLVGKPLDKSNVKIICFKESNRNYRWEITDENGMTYVFNEQEVTATATSSTITPQHHELTGNYTNLNYNSASTKQATAWYLTQISSPKTNARVHFEYYNDKIYTATSRLSFSEQYKEIIPSCASSTTGCSSSCSIAIGSGTGSTLTSSLNAIQNKYLKEIVFENGRVLFSVEEREDIQPLINNDLDFPFADVFVQNYGEIITEFPLNKPTDGKPQKVKSIVVKDKNNETVKEWNFEYSYFNEGLVNMNASSKTDRMKKYNNLRLRLDKAGEINTNGKIYNFTYKGDGISSKVQLPSKVSTQRDLFGYNNGQNGNIYQSNLIQAGYYPKLSFNPSNITSPSLNGFYFIPGIIRNVIDVEKTKGVLQTITYPTGGERTFYYESHEAPGGLGDVDAQSHFSSFLLTDASDTYYKLNVLGNCSGFFNGAEPTCNLLGTDLIAVFSNGTRTDSIRLQDLTRNGCRYVATSIRQCTYSYESDLLVATPGNYSITVLSNNFNMVVSTYKYHRTNNKTVKLGGLRVKSIHSNDLNGNVSRKNLLYETSQGNTSGVQLTPIVKYSYGYLEQLNMTGDVVLPSSCVGGDYGIILSAASLSPLGSSLGGNHVGYSRVVEEFSDFSGNASNGSIVYEFLNEPLTNLKPYSYFVDAPLFPSYGNGMPTKTTTYDAAENKVSEIIYSPTLAESNITVKGLLLSMGSDGQVGLKINPFYYDVRSEFWYNLSTTRRLYDGNGYTESVIKEVYNNVDGYYQLKEKWQTAPWAEKQSYGYNLWDKTRFYYPYDFSGSVAMTKLLQENRFNEVIETENTTVNWNGSIEVSNDPVSRERYNYQAVNSTFLPESKEVKYENGAWQTLVTYDTYDSLGNLTQYSQRGGTKHHLSYYNDLNSGKRNLLKSVEVDDGSGNANLRALQKQVFDYKPLIGLEKLTAPNALTQNYEYDNLNRLLRRRDHNGNMTEKYDYVYANDNGCPNIVSPVVTTVESLCSVTLTASGCNGVPRWNDGTVGSFLTVSKGEPREYTVSCTMGLCSSHPSSPVKVPLLGSTWKTKNVKNSPSPCLQQLSPDEFILKGSGGVSDTYDSLQYVYKEWSGNFTAIVKLSNLPSVNGNRSGIMVRSSLDPESPMLTIYQDGNSFVGINQRKTNGFLGFRQATNNSTWLKMTKVGNDFRVFYSTDTDPEVNNAWHEDFSWQNNGANPINITIGTTFYIGITAWGNNNQTSFDRLSIY